MSQSLAEPEVLFTAPTGAFFENLEAQDDGSVLFTSYFAKQILRWTPQGTTTFATLDVHPVGLVTNGSELIVSAHAKPFTAGPDFTKTMQIVAVDAKGGVRISTPMPEALFFNGVMRLSDGVCLIADSLTGVIWAYDVKANTFSIWLADTALKPVPGPSGDFALGANGIKLSAGFLYVSNSSTTTLHRVRVDEGHPVGALETVVKLHGIDDFAVADDGRIFIATHRNDVVMRGHDGQLTVLIDRNAEGATAVAFGRGASAGRLFVTTTGGLFAGLKANANLLAISIPK